MGLCAAKLMMIREGREKRIRRRRCGWDAVNLASQRAPQVRQSVQHCDSRRHLIRLLVHSHSSTDPKDTLKLAITAFDLDQHHRIAQACAEAALSSIKRDHIDTIEQLSQCRAEKRLLHSFSYDLIKENKRLVDLLHASDYEIAA